MGIFSKPKTTTATTATTEADDEKETSAAKKQRLLETEGEANGQTLNAVQGRSVRKIFGN